MVYTNTYSIVNKIAKPAGIKMTPITAAILTGAGASVILDQVNDDNKIPIGTANNAIITRAQSAPTTTTSTNQEAINLWQFIRLYTVAGIPIIDFFITYILIYVFNCFYFHYDAKIIVLLAIPVTIIYNLLTNKNVKISWFLIAIMIISVFLLFVVKPNKT